MAERAVEVNGKVEVKSTPGQGTKIEVEVPVNGNP
jgi:signal transduction histidine kinase